VSRTQSSAHILLIEDDPWLAKSYEATLSEVAPLIIVSSSVQAVESIDAELPSLIIADVMLEHGLVIDLLHELQSYSDTSSITTVLCTSLADRFSLRELSRYGVVKILDKATITPDLLRQVAREYA